MVFINVPVFHKAKHVLDRSIWCAPFHKSLRMLTGVGFMNGTDEVLMIMRLSVAINSGKVARLNPQRGICWLWITRGQPDLLPSPAISLHQQMAAGILSLKYPSASYFFML